MKTIAATTNHRRVRQTWLLILAMSASGLLFPGQTLDTLRFVAASFQSVAMTIALGLLVSAWVAASGAGTVAARTFTGHPVKSVIAASLVGAVTPVCGVTVLPLMTGMLAAGVPLAPVMAFWLSSPITDPGLFAATWATLGPAYAIGKTVAAFALGVFGGTATAAMGTMPAVVDPLRAGSVLPPSCQPGIGHPGGFSASIWTHADRMAVFRRELVAMAWLVGLCLGLAFAAEHLLRELLPAQLLADHLGSRSPWAVPLSVAVGAPIYLDGYAALPLVRGLMDLGMSPGAAMAFLVSGGVVSIWGALAIAPVLRLSSLLLYLVLAVSGSMLAGWGFDACMALVAPAHAP